MYDSRSDSGTHFLGVYSVFMRRVPYLLNYARHLRDEQFMSLLSLSPMSKASICENDPVEEVMEFDATAHVRQFEDVFSHYGKDVHKLSTCSLNDNASVNNHNTELLEVPHIELQPQIETRGQQDGVGMILCCPNYSILCIHRCLTAQRYFENVYASEYYIFESHPRQCDTLVMKIQKCYSVSTVFVSVADKDGATVTINRGLEFLNHTTRYEKQVTINHECIVNLQKGGITSTDCRFVLDTLVEQVEKFQEDSSSDFFMFNLDNKDIDLHSEISTHPYFEADIVKI